MKTIFIMFLSSIAFADTCNMGEALSIIRSSATWTVHGSTLIWQDTTQPRPTQAELNTAIANCGAAKAARQAQKLQAKQDVKNTNLAPAQRIDALLLLLDMDK